MASMGSFGTTSLSATKSTAASQTAADRTRPYWFEPHHPWALSSAPETLKLELQVHSPRILSRTLGLHTDTAQGNSTDIDLTPLVEQERLHASLLSQEFSPLFSSALDTNGPSASMETDNVLEGEELQDFASLPPSLLSASPSLSPVNNSNYSNSDSSYHGDEYGR